MGPRLVVKATRLFIKDYICLTTSDDCRRQLKKWVFPLFFLAETLNILPFETADFVCSKCSAFSALADVVGLSLVIK